MNQKRICNMVLMLSIIMSFIIKLILILYYKNNLTLSSDDLNYIKSAMVIAKNGIFTFDQYNEPTVFVMPLYPLFLAVVFKIMGFGLLGLQSVRVIQVILSCGLILVVFQMAKRLFNQKVAAVAAVLWAFYIPNITTPAYLLTETLFTFLFLLLIYLSLTFSEKQSKTKFAILGIIWAMVTMIRPTVLLYPGLLFLFLFISKKINFLEILKLGGVMVVTFSLIMSPWWVRNFKEYGEFIPLTAASGNPMLQGTYINYKQTAENIVYYKLGKNTFETNKIEMEVAKNRIEEGFKNNFWRMLGWYTVGKTVLFWCGTFYWKEFLGISQFVALGYHYVLLLGFIGMMAAIKKDIKKYLLPISVVVYFNIIHCIYMTFDRYAYPVMPIVTIFSAYLIMWSFAITKKYLWCKNRNYNLTK